MIDTKSRSVIKAATWRLFAVLLLAAITFAITLSWKAVTYVTLCYHLIQVLMYFVHERIWHSIVWGKTSGLFIQMTGMSGAGKSTLARLVAVRLRKQGYQVEILDGDEYRLGLCSDLGFSKDDRNTNIRRLGFVSKVLARNNVIAIIAAINPYEDVRHELDIMHTNVKTVYLKCPISVLKERDTKGLYWRALLPAGHPEKIENFTGISDPYEDPALADLVLETDQLSEDQASGILEKFVKECVQ